MRTFCHSLDRISATFDDENLVANAGLLAPASLAEHLGLRELLEERVDLGDAPGKANVGDKAMTVVNAVLAGADSIDDCGVLRAGSTSAVLGHGVFAPSTIGTFLRSFSWAHSRQLDAVAGEALKRAWAAGAGPCPGEAFTIDLDSSVHETYGAKKEGTRGFSYTKVHGYHPLYSMAGDDGQVLHSRLRGGSAHTGRGAVSFLTETFSRVRAAGVTGELQMRADSGFYSKKVVLACRKAKARFSITVKLYPNVLAAIAGIPDEAWKPIPYWIEDGADVAVVEWEAFKTKSEPGIACRLVVRRVRPTPGSQLALFAEHSYHAFITDREGGPVGLDQWHREHANCENAIRDLKYGVGLNHLPSGRFGANAAWLALNVIAHNLSRWLVRIGNLAVDDTKGADDPKRAKSFVATETLRLRYLAVPARLASSARRLTAHMPARWPWNKQLEAMLAAVRAVRLVT